MNDRTAAPSEARVPRYASEIPDAPGYYVYRLWAGDTCLYVGRVGNSGPRSPRARLNHHRRLKSWWPQVTRIEVATFPDLPSIVTEERAQIAALKPPHNRQSGNCLHDLSLPNAIEPSNGMCRICNRERQRRGNLTRAQLDKTRQRDKIRQPEHNAARRRRRRAAGTNQGSLW